MKHWCGMTNRLLYNLCVLQLKKYFYQKNFNSPWAFFLLMQSLQNVLVSFSSAVCQGDRHGTSYEGTVAVSISGKRCLPWRDHRYVFPAHHLTLPIDFLNFLPSGLQGEENQCRNSRAWQFYMTDPICAVWDADNNRATLEACLVPQCRTKRKSHEWNDHSFRNI